MFQLCFSVCMLLLSFIIQCSHALKAIKILQMACSTSSRRTEERCIWVALPYAGSGRSGRLRKPWRHFDSYYGMPSKVYSYVCVRCIGGCCLDEIAEHMQSTHILQRLHILYSWTTNIIYCSKALFVFLYTLYSLKAYFEVMPLKALFVFLYTLYSLRAYFEVMLTFCSLS